MERLPKKYFGSISDYVKTYYTAWGVTSFADKAYNAVKTVTKDFTRTDPVYVRVGEDGEPEIHYTMTQADGGRYFADMDLGNATLYVHNGAVLNACGSMFSKAKLKKLSIDSLKNAGNVDFILESYPSDTALKTFELGYPIIGEGKEHTIYTSRFLFAYRNGLTAIPAIDMSNLKTLNYAFYGTSISAIHAYGMKVSFDLSETALKHDAILEVFNNLGTVDKTAGITLTLRATKLALMSDAEKAIATEKGWTLA